MSVAKLSRPGRRPNIAKGSVRKVGSVIENMDKCGKRWQTHMRCPLHRAPRPAWRKIMSVADDRILKTCHSENAPASPCKPILLTANSGRRGMDKGIAQYDPACVGRPAWNAGRMVGVDLRPKFIRFSAESAGSLPPDPTSDRRMMEFSGCHHSGGPVAPPGLCSAIGTLHPIAE